MSTRTQWRFVTGTRTRRRRIEPEPGPPMPVPPDPGEPAPPLPEPIPGPEPPIPGPPEPDRAALLLRLAELPRAIAEPRRSTVSAGGLVRLRRTFTAV